VHLLAHNLAREKRRCPSAIDGRISRHILNCGGIKHILVTGGITTKELDHIIDNTPFKQDKIAPGSWLPVRPPEMLLKDHPDFALLLAWNFAPEIIKRKTEYQKRGGRFIVPIPKPAVIDFKDEAAPPDTNPNQLSGLPAARHRVFFILPSHIFAGYRL
jgi:hypothetical protein